MPPRYDVTNFWLYEALGKYSIEGKNVGIFGSIDPWFESVCLSYGGVPTTIEYQKITSNDERLKVMTVSEYDQSPIKFDASFSISSFEHDGLGRFGDPIDPRGDIKAMKKMKKYVKKGSYLFLSVPVGMDAIVWNAHRIYGKKRLKDCQCSLKVGIWWIVGVLRIKFLIWEARSPITIKNQFSLYLF